MIRFRVSRAVTLSEVMVNVPYL